jgi:RNA polymerase sigma factor (TIGR02999 family)
MADATRILSAIEQGDAGAAAQLLPLVSDELRKLAAAKMAQENPGQTLQATALVHEAYIRLVDVEKAQHWDSRAHFFAAAAEAMRRILVEIARRKARLKHGGGYRQIPLDHAVLPVSSDREDVLAIDQALTRLAEADASAARLVELRLFAGMSVEESAEMLGMSVRNAYYAWDYARSWLRVELEPD